MNEVKIFETGDDLDAASSNAARNYSNPVNALEDLRYRQQNWSANAYAASNKELYNILLQCLAIYQQIHKTPTQVAAFRARCEQLDMRFKSSTGLINRVVAFVFGGNSKRVSGYARVLTVAKAECVDPMDLPTWIAAQGGLEEVRAKQSGRKTPAQRAADNRAKGAAAANGAIAVNKLKAGKFVLKDAATPFVAMLGRVVASGEIELISVLSDEKAVNAVLATYGATAEATELGDARKAAIQAADERVMEAIAAS